MLRTLEIAWLCLAIICIATILYKLFNDGWEDAVWLSFVTVFTFVMFIKRRKQRIKQQLRKENELYH